MNQSTMHLLRTAIDVRKLELVTEQIAKINREAAIRAEVARELDDLVAALNQTDSTLGAGKPHLVATPGLTRFPIATLETLGEAPPAPPRLPW
jgi:hypothetical protein